MQYWRRQIAGQISVRVRVCNSSICSRDELLEGWFIIRDYDRVRMRTEFAYFVRVLGRGLFR